RSLLSQPELEAAMRDARERQQPLEPILLERYRVSKKDLGNALSTFYRCPFFEPSEQTVIDLALVQGLNLAYLQAQCWIPLRETEDTIEVLIDDPHSFEKRRDIRRVFSSKKIQFVVGLPDDILALINAAKLERDAQAPLSAI